MCTPVQAGDAMDSAVYHCRGPPVKGEQADDSQSSEIYGNDLGIAVDRVVPGNIQLTYCKQRRSSSSAGTRTDTFFLPIIAVLAIDDTTDAVLYESLSSLFASRRFN